MNNLRMRTKLSIGFGLSLFLTLIIGITAIYQLGTIDKEVTFVKEALTPQMKSAINMDMQMRIAGLNIRKFADIGSDVTWQLAMDALSKIKETLSSANLLAQKQTNLQAMPTFLATIPGPLKNFEDSCNAIRSARETMSKAIEVILKEGSVTIETLNELIDTANIDIRKAAETADMKEVTLVYTYLDRYNDIFDLVENVRIDIFVALSTNNRELLTTVMKGFANPLQELQDMKDELILFPEIQGKVNKTLNALINLEVATKSLVLSVEKLDATDLELVNSYNAALKLVNSLVEVSAKHNDGIATNLVDNAKKSIYMVSIVLTIAILLGLLMTIILTLNITNQLTNFVQAAQKLSAGQFDTRVDVLSKDEIGITAAGINKAFDVVVDKVLWYEAMLDSIPSPITVTDKDRRWTFINKATEKLLGRTRQDVLGHLCSEWNNPMCNTPNCPIQRLQYGETLHKLVVDDKEFSILVSYITDRKGHKIGYIELLQDITALSEAQHKAESALSEGMRTAASKLEGVVGKVSGVVADISKRIKHAEHGSTEQAARITSTASAMDEMNITVMDVAKNASSAALVSASTRQKAIDGASTVREVVEGIKVVQKDSLVLKGDMALLSEHAQAISQIMSVISDIADQTNLLALNAAIEAARAGDAGRGFAVVADEVRKLAEKTMLSTLDVSNAIRSIQQSAEKSTKQVDIAVLGIERATDLAEHSGAALTEIVHMVDEAVAQVRAIASTSEKQSMSSEGINHSIMQVNTIATDTLQAMHEASRGVSELVDQTHILSKVMNEMKYC